VQRVFQVDKKSTDERD